METSLAAIVIGALVAMWLTPAVRRWASMTRLVDDPRKARSIHQSPIPRVGGVALAAAMLCPIAGLAIWENQISELMYQDARMLVTLLLSALAVLALGIVDDLASPPAQKRLLILVGIALFSWLGGHRIEALELPLIGLLELGLWSAPATVFWIVGVIVAFNFMDGLDGLATGIALIATLTMFCVALLEGNQLWMTWSGAMAGALLGFLVFNFNPASVFLGNSGSNFVGYMLAVVALETNRTESTAFALLVPMLALGLPILDAALTMVRRALLREGMFLGELGHLHHRLLDHGLSHRRVVLCLWGVSVLMCLGALVAVTGIEPLQALVAVTISGVLLSLLFVTGYIHPNDLQLLWQRGVKNLARDQALAELAHQIRARESGEAAGNRLDEVLERLTSESAISGAAYMERGAALLVVGDYDEQARGVRARIPVHGATHETVTFLWRGRTSGPSPRELATLRGLLSTLDSSTD